MKNQWILLFLCLVIPFLTPASGCRKKGLDTQYVEGIVTVDGQPTKGVHLRFIPKDPDNLEEASGITDENGKYTLTSTTGEPQQGAVIGEYAVKASMLDMTPVGPQREGVEVLSYKELLPSVYLDKDSTPLSASVKKGKNLELNFAIETKK
jgi:hypothetical protein